MTQDDKQHEFQSMKLMSRPDAVEQVVRLAHAGMTPQRVTNRANRLDEQYIIPLTGELVTVQPDGYGINAVVRSPESLVHFIAGDIREPQQIRVFVGETAIVGVFEDVGEITRRVVCPLRLSPAFALLKTYCDTAGYMAQEALWILLKRDFAGMIERGVVEQIRQAILRVNAAKRQETGHAKQVREVSYEEAVRSGDGDDFPEEIVLRVPVFDLIGARGDRYEVLVNLLARNIQQEIKFLLLPESLTMGAVMDSALEALVERINQESSNVGVDMMVLYGEPDFDLRITDLGPPTTKPKKKSKDDSED